MLLHYGMAGENVVLDVIWCIALITISIMTICVLPTVLSTKGLGSWFSIYLILQFFTAFVMIYELTFLIATCI